MSSGVHPVYGENGDQLLPLGHALGRNDVHVVTHSVESTFTSSR